MNYTFNLHHVNGNSYTWTIPSSHIVIDKHKHVLSFTVDFKDGTSEHFALGNEGSFVRTILSSLSTGGAAAGRRYGAAGAAVGVIAGWLAEQILENVVLHNADYYDSAGKLAFRGPPIKLQ